MPVHAESGTVWKARKNNFHSPQKQQISIAVTKEIFFSESEKSQREAEYASRQWKARVSINSDLLSWTEAQEMEREKLDELRQRLPAVLIGEICTKVHHASYTLDHLVEEVHKQFSELYVKGEKVIYKKENEKIPCEVVRSSRHGGAVKVDLKTESGEAINGVPRAQLERGFKLSEEDVENIITLTASRSGGKPWQVDDEFKREYNIKDKLAPIFSMMKDSASSPAQKKVAEPVTLSDSSDDDDEPLVARRSTGMAPGKHLLKKQAVDNTKKAKESAAKDAKKALHAKEKELQRAAKEKEKNDKKEAKEKEKNDKKDAKEKEKQAKKDAKDAEKEKKKADKKGGTQGSISKFVIAGAPGSSASPFMSPANRHEKRFENMQAKLNKEWKSKDLAGFQVAVQNAARVLTKPQMDRLEPELIRYSVNKAYTSDKDKEMMKKMSKEQKSEFRAKLAEQRAMNKHKDAAVTQYFNEKEDDLSLKRGELACPGEKIDLPADQLALLPECLTALQFIYSASEILDAKTSLISAEDLCAALCSGEREQWVAKVYPLLHSLLLPLTQDRMASALYPLLVRMNNLVLNEHTASELARATVEWDNRPYMQQAQTILKKIESVVNREKRETSVGGGEKEKAEEESGVEHVEEEGERRSVTPEQAMGDDSEAVALLSRWPLDVEMWQLNGDDQMAVISVICRRFMNTDGYNDFIDEARKNEPSAVSGLKEKLSKKKASVDELKSELEQLPQLPDDIEGLSRTESRRIEDERKRRNNVEDKIEKEEASMEEMQSKITHLLDVHAMSLRVSPVGEDRHFRRYYWFGEGSPDAGLWVQDFGKTLGEKLIVEELAEKETLKAVEEALEKKRKEGEKAEGGTPTKTKTTPSKDKTPDIRIAVTKCAVGADALVNEVETWWRVTSREGVEGLVGKLLENGVRESGLRSQLKKALKAGRRLQAEERRSGSRETSQDKEVLEPTAALRAQLVEMASQLAEAKMCALEADEYAQRVAEAGDDMQKIKPLMVEVVSSVPSRSILVFPSDSHHSFAERKTNLNLKMWKDLVATAENASRLHLLLAFADSRINWESGVRNKACRACGRKRNIEDKIPCVECGEVRHSYCFRGAVPEGEWRCEPCDRKHKQKMKAEAKANGADEEMEDEGGSDEEEEKPSRARGARKRAIIDDSDFEDDVEEKEEEEEENRGRRAPKRGKHENTVLTNSIYSVLAPVRASRVYRSLQNVPAMRATRQQSGISMAICENAASFKTIGEFKRSLLSFFQHALHYFEDRANNRGYEQLEELMQELELDGDE